MNITSTVEFFEERFWEFEVLNEEKEKIYFGKISLQEAQKIGAPVKRLSGFRIVENFFKNKQETLKQIILRTDGNFTQEH